MLYCYLCNMYMWVHLHRFPALFSALTLTVTCTTVQENKRKEVVNIASKWQEQSEQIRAKLGVVDARPWTKLISNRYTALPQTKRVLEILDLGALDHILSKSSAGQECFCTQAMPLLGLLCMWEVKKILPKCLESVSEYSAIFSSHVPPEKKSEDTAS